MGFAAILWLFCADLHGLLLVYAPFAHHLRIDTVMTRCYNLSCRPEYGFAQVPPATVKQLAAVGPHKTISKIGDRNAHLQ